MTRMLTLIAVAGLLIGCAATASSPKDQATRACKVATDALDLTLVFRPDANGEQAPQDVQEEALRQMEAAKVKAADLSAQAAERDASYQQLADLFAELAEGTAEQEAIPRMLELCDPLLT
jgi:predicted component of type VI protein secretion system